MPHRTDDALMNDYVRGDENALRILVERWEQPVFVFLFRMLGSQEEAEDLRQDTFMNLIKAADRYKPEGKFRSCLFRIAGNQARSRCTPRTGSALRGPVRLRGGFRRRWRNGCVFAAAWRSANEFSTATTQSWRSGTRSHSPVNPQKSPPA